MSALDIRCALAALILAGLAGGGLAGCGADDATPVSQDTRYRGTLDADIRGTAITSIIVHPGGAADISIQLDTATMPELVDASAPLVFTAGKVEPFLENGSVLYTGKLSRPAVAGGPCGSQPVSLALSLHRRGAEARVGGSLTAYCGEARFFGVPARILRLTGQLPAQ
jgi:hypothetical protein